jgi:hypothetical protein
LPITLAFEEHGARRRRRFVVIEIVLINVLIDDEFVAVLSKIEHGDSSACQGLVKRTEDGRVPYGARCGRRGTRRAFATKRSPYEVATSR